jgi:hypothetical protein
MTQFYLTTRHRSRLTSASDSPPQLTATQLIYSFSQFAITMVVSCGRTTFNPEQNIDRGPATFTSPYLTTPCRLRACLAVCHLRQQPATQVAIGAARNLGTCSGRRRAPIQLNLRSYAYDGMICALLGEDDAQCVMRLSAAGPAKRSTRLSVADPQRSANYEP